MSGMTDMAKVELIINSEPAIKELNNLQNNLSKAKEKLETLKTQGAPTKEIVRAQKEVGRLTQRLAQAESRSKAVERALTDMDKRTPRELNASIRTLMGHLQGLQKGSEAWKLHAEAIRMLKGRLAELKEELKAQEPWWNRAVSWINKWQTAIVGVVAGSGNVIDFFRQSVDAYADMDQEMANVRKFTGMTEEQVADLNDEFKKIDTRTGREQLNKLAQEAGRLGKSSKEDVLGYVRAADQIKVSLDDLGDGATLTLSKLTGVFGVEQLYGTEDALLKVGSVVNELSQNCKASAPYLTNFTERMGGVGAQAKMSISQIMGLGAVLDDNAQQVEASATAISQVLVRMMADPAKYARVAGLDVQNFTRLLKEDANAALLDFLQALNNAGGMDVLSPMFKDMGENGSRAIAALSTLAIHIDDVRAQQKAASIAFEEGTSVTNEFNVQNNTIQASLEKAKNKVQELRVELGEKLTPVMSHIISTGSLLLRCLLTAIDFVSTHKAIIMTLTATIVANTIVMNTNLIKIKAVTVATKSWTLATMAFNKIAPVFKLLIAGITNSIQYFTNGLNVNYKMQLRWRNAMAAMNFTHWSTLIMGVALAVYALYRKMTELSAIEKDMISIREKGQQGIADQIAKIQTLQKAANDETLSLEEQKKAVDKLNAIIPDYNGHLDETTRKYKANDEALKSYISTLTRKYELEGAKELLADIGKEKATATKDLKTAETNADNARKNLNSGGGISYTTSFGAVGNTAIDSTFDLEQEVKSRKATLQKILDRENAIINAYGIELEKDAIAESNPENNDYAQPITTTSTNKDKNSKDRFAEEKAWRAKVEAEARIAYARGETTYTEHTNRMNDIDATYQSKLLARHDLTDDERLKITADYWETVNKRTVAYTKELVDEENTSYEELTRKLKDNHLRQLQATNMSASEREQAEKQFQETTELAELKHLARLVDIYDEGSDERLKAQQRYQDAELAAAKRHQQEREKLESEYSKIKTDYFGDNQQEKDTKYQQQMDALTVVYERELAAAEGNADEKLRIEKAYLEAQAILRNQYNQQSEEETQNSYIRMATNFGNWLNSDGGKALTGTLNFLVSGMSSIFSGLSTMVQAELDIQTAQIENRYDKELQLAQGNSYKVAKLEKKKEADIAKAKSQANKKMFAMQVIQAVAQSVQSGLNAYSSTLAIPIVGPALAPAAMALALATGAIQVAALKKQQQASEAQGYADGGFTKPGAKYEPAGIVHAGEWVASQQLLASPVARPMIEALDYVQRTNTIGSLKPEDVSRSITATQSLSRMAESDNSTALVIASISQNAKAVADLNNRLNEPFVTVNTVTGDHGIKQAQDEYTRLVNNVTPKKYKK